MDSESNVTNKPLLVGATWDGQYENVSKFNAVSLSCASDVDCKVKLHFTNDGQKILHVNEYSVKADVPFHIFEGIKSKYFRASVLNDSGKNMVRLSVDCIFSNNSRDALIVSLDSRDSFIVDISGQTVNIGSMPPVAIDLSGIALEVTQSSLLTLAERQDLNGVKINADHPPLTSYDYNNNKNTMTMKSPTLTDERWTIDSTNNRDGWKFSNSNGDTVGGNCYFYANNAGTGEQQKLLYENFTSFYCVVTMDRCDNVNDTPFFVCYSYPTGSNDVIPSFAHSRWQFVLPTGSQLFQGEKVLLYYGAIPTVHSTLRHLPLELTTIGNNGSRLGNEMIYLMTINTQSARAVGSVDYMLHNAGFVALDIGREYAFSNSLQRKKLANLSATNIPVVISNTSLPVTGSFYPATQPISNGQLDKLSFQQIDTSTNALNATLVHKTATQSYTKDNIDNNDDLPIIDMRNYDNLTIFGRSESTTGGTAPIQIQYSVDGVNFFASNNSIWTSSGQPFSWDNSYSGKSVPFLKLHLQQEYSVFDCHVCQK